MLRVGLTGGIGAGKSEVSRRLAGQGAVIVDADAIAREVVAPGTAGLARVVAAFGSELLRPDGALDRERLGEVVFADPAALARLNGIVHPLVGIRMTELETTAGKDAIVVHDVPLISENNLASAYDVVVVVDAPDQLRLDRLMKLRGMSEEQARARMAAQASREQRLAIADFVIDNSGSLAELDRQVGDLWAELRRRSRRHDRSARRSASPGDDPRNPRGASPGDDPRNPRSASPGDDPRNLRTD